MKYLFLNLKRFDISVSLGGVNTIAPPAQWGSYISEKLATELRVRKGEFPDYTFAAFFPEAHLIPAAQTLARHEHTPLRLGCQSVHFADTAKGGNFGAFTTLRPAHAAAQLGCEWAIVGHSEERSYLTQIMAEAGAPQERIFEATHRILRKKVECARAAGLKVLYCIGEKTEEIPVREEIIRKQIEQGLGNQTADNVVLAYEPIWAIGPGKTPPSAPQIQEIAENIKRICPLPLVYGGGLKRENARAVGGIQALDGGLIALTRFTGDIGFYPEEYMEIVTLYNQGGM